MVEFSTSGKQANDPAETDLQSDRLAASVYNTLRRLARTYLRNERAGHTLQPTALVHEAYLQLVHSDEVQWQSRNHFIGTAARAMRQVLIQHAKRRSTLKRGSGHTLESLDESVTPAESGGPDLIALAEALEELATFDSRASQIVELRFFGGLTVKEAAELVGVSEITARRDCVAARAWLNRYLTES